MAEKRQIHQGARIAINAFLGAHPLDKSWAKHFWRQNLELAPCKPHGYTFFRGKAVTQDQATLVSESLDKNASAALAYLEQVGKSYKYDLYDTERDEILLGLFSRLTRLYVRFCTDPGFWARDMAGIMLRCAVDTGITFVYLAKYGDESVFRDFRRYGEGKQKLLMLHLQDTYDKAQSLEGNTAQPLLSKLAGKADRAC